MKGAPVAVALLFAGLCAGAALRAFIWEPPPREAAIPPGDVARARDVLARLARALVLLQREDGSFDRTPGDEDSDPEVRKTASDALALAALARARSLGITVDGLDAALAKGIGRLKARQTKGGAFAAMESGPRADPKPSLEATAAGLMALVLAGRPEDDASLRRAVAAFQLAVAYGSFQGWTRGLAAIAVHTVAAGGVSRFTKGVGELVATGSIDRVDCGDYRLAEAIARRVRAGAEGDPLVDTILAACLEDPDRPKWTGDSTAVDSWYLQAWLAARSPKGREWFRRVLPAIEKGLEPKGRLSESVYADVVTQNACALLALAEGLVPPAP